MKIIQLLCVKIPPPNSGAFTNVEIIRSFSVRINLFPAVYQYPDLVDDQPWIATLYTS